MLQRNRWIDEQVSLEGIAYLIDSVRSAGAISRRRRKQASLSHSSGQE